MTTGSQIEFADWIGVKRSYVSELKNNGRLVFVEGENGKQVVDFEASKLLIEQTGDPRKAGNGKWREGQEGEKRHEMLAQAKIKQAVFKAQLQELDFKKKSAELVDRASYEMAAMTTARLLRDSLIDTFPIRVAQELAVKSDAWEIESFLRNKLRDELREICRVLE